MTFMFIFATWHRCERSNTWAAFVVFCLLVDFIGIALLRNGGEA
jgi:hypothetical protein